MPWQIKCDNPGCNEQTWAENIVDLIQNHTNSAGWFMCRCGERGHIEKSFALQEEGEKWEPFLKGVIPLGTAGDSYQPFVFLVGGDARGPADAIWFSYYKDLRSTGGRLKLGYGPGGPPVLEMQQVVDLVRKLSDLRCLPQDEIRP
jgi:hypothetical protein